MIKSLSLLTRKPGMTHEQFVRHWLEVHGPLAHKVPGLRRYVQSHIVEERTRPDIPSTDVEIDGVAELWYDDRESMLRALATPEAKALYATARCSSGGSRASRWKRRRSSRCGAETQFSLARSAMAFVASAIGTQLSKSTPHAHRRKRW